jgi:predicted TIM-barrel fold metal-dependent hydrolase
MGSKSIKLYTGHSYGMSWRMDDRTVAYPMFERMLELGCDLVQVHKGDPQGMEPLESLHPGDVHQAAIDFPDMTFIVHHLAFPFDDVAIDLAARLPNVYLSMSTWINMVNIAPREVATRMGKALLWCGPGKLIYGSEVPLWPSSQRLLELMWDLEIPEDLQLGWGYPEITDEDRRLMFGATMLRLLGMPEAPPADAPVLRPPVQHPTAARPSEAAIAATVTGPVSS